MSWYFEDQAKIADLNPQQEGPKDNPKRVLHIKLQAVAGVEELREALGAATSKEVQEAFWSPVADYGEGAADDPGMVRRFPGLGSFKVKDREFDGMMATIAGKTISPATVGKFEVEILDDARAKLGFQITTWEPENAVLAVLWENMKEDVYCRIVERQLDLGV